VNPPALPTLLHYFCTTITQYTTPLRPPVYMPYAIQYRSRQYRVKANLRRMHTLQDDTPEACEGVFGLGFLPALSPRRLGLLAMSRP